MASWLGVRVVLGWDGLLVGWLDGRFGGLLVVCLVVGSVVGWLGCVWLGWFVCWLVGFVGWVAWLIGGLIGWQFG